jgi:predicted ester cyclase
MDTDHNKLVAIESFRLIETGDSTLAARIVASDFVNHEAEDDDNEPDRKLPGPVGFLATSRWLRNAFSDLRFDEIEALGEDNRVVVRATMTGRHTGTFQGVLATGKQIRQRQVHFFRLRRGQLIEHAAQRDDLGLLLQIGWRPEAEMVQEG